MPGIMPEIKSLPMDTSVAMPYTMKVTLGGISRERLAPEATDAVERLSL